MKTSKVEPGSGFATGRPATGRTHGISVRISSEAYELLRKKKNKSQYIDCLIKNDRIRDHEES